MLTHLLEHVRRGKLAVLWQHLLARANKDLNAFQDDPSPGYIPEL